MSFIQTGKRVIAATLVASTTLLALPNVAQASIVRTEEVVQQADGSAQRRVIDAFFAREDVRLGLEQHGVDREAALARVDAMSDHEVAALAGQIEQAPAGGDILGVAVFLFLVLLVTDILGLTKVFPFTRSVR